MQVIRADYAGACYGVQRALDLAMDAARENDHACTLGPLIHNPQVVDKLAAQGVDEAHSLDEVEPGETVVIRSHGVTPAVMRQVRAKTDRVIDATCPFVARAQQGAADLAQRDGCVIVVGEAGHPEVEGLVATAREANAKVYTLVSPDQLPEKLYEPVGIVVQTTQRRETLQAVIDALEARGISPELKDTICTATRQRQDAAARLAAQVDAIVVIGGRNSSNTTRLAEICQGACERTFHIEAPDELDPAWFKGCLTVGVTAGASTPEDQIAAVERCLERL